MRCWHVFSDGAELAATHRAGVARHPRAAGEQLHRPSGDPGIEALADQGVRDAVAVAIDLDAVVDVDLDALEAGELVAAGRQRHECGAIDVGEHARPRAGQLLERARVQCRQQRGDCAIGLVDATKALVTKPRQDPAGDPFTADFAVALLRGECGRAGSTEVP